MRSEAELRLALDRLESARQCRNLMSRFVHWYASGQGEALAELWLDQSGCRYEEEALCLTGSEAIQAWFRTWKQPLPRRVELYTLDTEVLEVAPDGRTAQGCWLSPGNAADPDLPSEERVRWVWSEYTAEFARDNRGQWKLYQLTARRIFRARYCGGLCAPMEKGRENKC